MTTPPSTTAPPERGFLPVLANRQFRALWAAQWLAQIGQNAINFIQLILIEQLTGSTVQIGITILAFTLPGVIFSPMAGVVADRLPKKWVLVGSNFSRAAVALSYLIVLAGLQGGWRLVGIYLLTFLMSTLSQFFAPAEGAMIPLLVGEQRLLAANSLFSLTMVLSQMAGLVVLGPIIVRLLGLVGGLIAIGVIYLGATVLVSLLPTDRTVPQATPEVTHPWARLWTEFREGLAFIATQGQIQAAIGRLIAINALVMIMAMLAPGYAARVLGMRPENAVIVFAPAGVGMLLATAVVGRWGYLLRRLGFGHVGLTLAGLAFFGMGLLSLDYHRFMRPILDVAPEAALSLTTITMGLGVVLGFSLSATNILAQTRVQQDSPAPIRGRVLSVQFMLANLVGILPMLAFGGLADTLGIPRVLQLIGVATLSVTALIALLSAIQGRWVWLWRRDRAG